MTQIDFAATAQPTPFAVLLENAATPHELAVYRGVLTPLELDAPEAETAALTTGTACHDLGWLRRVAVRGEDRFRWLSGMVTNMVNDLPGNTGAWNLVLNAQGRIQGDLIIWHEDNGLELEIAADQCDRLLAHFDRFIIMDDVELVPLNGEAALGLTGQGADAVLARVGLPTLSTELTCARVEWNGINLRVERGFGAVAVHYALWAPEAQIGKVWKYLRAAGATPVGCKSFEAFRIAEGIPAYGIDMVERDLPQETSQIRALHFSKGCYLGQEIVERIRSRGNVHKHLRQLELAGPAPSTGTELRREDGTVAGEIRSAAELALSAGPRVFALAMIRADAEVSNEALTYTAGTATGIAKLMLTPPSF